jgi:hypothetical protein
MTDARVRDRKDLYKVREGGGGVLWKGVGGWVGG